MAVLIQIADPLCDSTASAAKSLTMSHSRQRCRYPSEPKWEAKLSRKERSEELKVWESEEGSRSAQLLAQFQLFIE